jgi:hypothetical protein
MRTTRILIVALAGTLGIPALAAAQPHSRPAAEVGLSLDGLFSWRGTASPFGGLRIGIPISDRFAIEGLTTFIHEHEATAGLYGVQVRQRFGNRGGSSWRPFATYGAAGVFAHYEEESFVSPPLIGLVGAGADRSIGGGMAVRIEAQAVMVVVVPVTLRLSAGISIPIGARR